MKTVTALINDCHSTNNSTIGQNEMSLDISQPLTPNINLSTAYAFKSVDDLAEYHKSKFNNNRYTRDSSNLTQQVELYFEKIFDGKKAFLFNTGMASVITAIEITSTDVKSIITFGVNYRKTEQFIEKLVALAGLTTTKFSNFKALVEDNSFSDSGSELLIFIENFSNPYLNFAELRKIRERYPKAKIVVDATMLGLCNGSNDLSYADIICLSCTKYIGGHNDFLAGCVIVNNENYLEDVWNYRSLHGTILTTFSTYLLLRSLRTYDLRMREIINNTTSVLKYLEENIYIKKIYYPGQHENRDETLPQCVAHGGGVVSVLVDDSIDVKKNLEVLRFIKMAPSFGSVDSLIEIPVFMSKRSDQKSSEGNLDLYDENFLRISIGCEPINYLLDDLNRVIGK